MKSRWKLPKSGITLIWPYRLCTYDAILISSYCTVATRTALLVPGGTTARTTARTRTKTRTVVILSVLYGAVRYGTILYCTVRVRVRVIYGNNIPPHFQPISPIYKGKWPQEP